MVTATPRDFSSLALPAEYVSAAGPFQKISATEGAAQRISQVALLSAAAGQDACRGIGATRDLGIAKQCSNVFGASLVNVEETD